jgi:hypothetical protein
MSRSDKRVDVRSGDPSVEEGSMRGKAFDVVARAAGIVVVAVGGLLAGSGAYAATSRVTELAPRTGIDSTGTADLTISAVASLRAAEPLYPGANGDVVVTISNRSASSVTITAVSLPSDATFGTGYTTRALTTKKTGCLATTPSGVVWNYSAGVAGIAHKLAKPLTLAANGRDDPLTVTFIDAAEMTRWAPAACEGAYFSMPAMTGVTIRDDRAPVTTSPTTDEWTS